jgi:hypothetical protein
VVPLLPCGLPLLGCLLAWTLVLAPCFFFLSLSWVLSFYKIWQGFIIFFCLPLFSTLKLIINRLGVMSWSF